MKPAFVTTYYNARGSCNPAQVEKLTTTFQEAVDAIQKAVEAMTNLKKPRFLHISKDGRRTWDRQAQLLKALFNIDVDSKSGISSKDKGNANDVQQNFQNMLNGLDYKDPSVARRYWLFCGDNWLQWRAPTDTNEYDKHEPKRTVGFFHQGSGAFHAKVFVVGKSIENYIRIPNVPVTQPICGRGNPAGTLRGFEAVTFCNVAFGYNQLSPMKSSIRPGDTLDRADEEAVNERGEKISGIHANAWVHGVNLARFDPASSRRTPDPYALFATAVYFDNYGWGTGIAEE
ncbi:MAG: hypothetical protein Q9180_003184 [Flavoplaca navasiana]